MYVSTFELILTLQRLKHFESEENTGCLYGIMYDGNLLVLGLSLELFENENSYKQLLLSLPTEIELCGAIKFSGNLSVESRMKEILQVIYRHLALLLGLRCLFVCPTVYLSQGFEA